MTLLKLSNQTLVFLQVSSKIRDICDVINLQRDLQEWNKCSLLSKCKVMHLGRNSGTTYTMENLGSTVELTTTDLEKDLGVWIMLSLKPSLQCDKAMATAWECLNNHSPNYPENCLSFCIKLMLGRILNTIFNFGVLTLPVTLKTYKGGPLSLSLNLLNYLMNQD